ncbi:hypothetical protein SAMN05421578_102457 [Paenibacillus macquariensis]|uniref:Lipoprotein n=2 Tax=Paenibacillus macquariensis TaxID=948756 RepID=A0ABY1JPF9_9BACL|nr:hypothetical protein SAMN05421578_102457 [Paenibacillus macquariensis]
MQFKIFIILILLVLTGCNENKLEPISKIFQMKARKRPILSNFIFQRGQILLSFLYFFYVVDILRKKNIKNDCKSS